MKTCSVEGCAKPLFCKGVCNMHYGRMQKFGCYEIPQKPSINYHSRYATWQNVKKRFKLEGVGWADFREFTESVGERPGYSHVIVKKKDDEIIGPTNFEWVLRSGTNGRNNPIFEYRTKEGRKAYDEHLSKTRPDRVIEANLRKAYGLSMAEYKQLHADQNGKCAICGEEESLVKRGKIVALSVDHDHGSGKVRGLLCNVCNRGLGLFRDNPTYLRKAADYLSR